MKKNWGLVWCVVGFVALVFALFVAAFLAGRIEDLSILTEPESPKYNYAPLVMNDYSGPKAVCQCRGGCESLYAVGANRARVWYPMAPKCPGVVTHPAVSTIAHANRVLSGTLEITPRGTDLVFGFNEPYLNGIDPAVAAHKHHEIKLMYPDLRLATPGISHHSASLDWLVEFTHIYTSTYDEFPSSVLDWHCYWNSAEQCIEQAEAMMSLADRWNEQGANITTLTISEVGIVPDNEFAAFMRWLDYSPINLWFPFCTEIADWPQFTLVVPGSDPPILTDRGNAFKDH